MTRIVFKLKEVMEQNGYSVKRLAEEMGVSEYAVVQWRTGVNQPKWINIEIMLDVLGCEISDLFGTEKF